MKKKFQHNRTKVECFFGKKRREFEQLPVLALRFESEDLSEIEILCQKLGDLKEQEEIEDKAVKKHTKSSYNDAGIYFLKPNQELIRIFEKSRKLKGVQDIRRVFYINQSIAIETNILLLKLKRGYKQSDIEPFLRKNKAKVVQKRLKTLYVVEVDANIDTLKLSLELGNHRVVDFVTVDFDSEVRPKYTPNDKYYSRQWHLHNNGINPNNINTSPVIGGAGIPGKIGADIQAETAWDKLIVPPDPIPKAGIEVDTNRKIRVAVWDLGFDVQHPDLNVDHAASIDIDGAFFKVGSANINPYFSGFGFDHGTVCAGCVGGIHLGNATTNDGIAGVAFGSELILMSSGPIANVTGWCTAIQYAADPFSVTGLNLEGADIFTTSIGEPSFGAEDIVQEAVDYAIKYGRRGRGMVMTYAVENAYRSVKLDPLSNIKEFIKVGRTDPNDRYNGSAYAETIDDLDVVAPGYEIASTQFRIDQAGPNGPVGPAFSRIFKPNKLNDPSLRAGLPWTERASGYGFLFDAQNLLEDKYLPQPPASPIAPFVLNIPNGGHISTYLAGPDPNGLLFDPLQINTIDPSLDSGYEFSTIGTSFSTPITAGMIALVLGMKTKLSWVEIKKMLRETSDKVDLDLINSVPTDSDLSRDLSWYTQSNNTVIDPITNNMVIDSTAPVASTSLNTGGGNLDPTIDDVEHGSKVITVNGGANNFDEGQAILLGKQTFLTALPDLSDPGFDKIEVDDISGFSVGDFIEIGKGAKTYVAADTTLLEMDGRKLLEVFDATGFKKGDVIQITGGVPAVIKQLYTIDEISLDSSGYPFFKLNSPIPITNNFGRGDIVEKAFDIIQIDIINAASKEFQLVGKLVNSSSYIVNSSVQLRGSEVGIVKEIIDSNNIRIDSIRNSFHDNGRPVIGGLTPHYSNAVGYGRVNAFKMVSEAEIYQFHDTAADLMIRDYDTDDGISTVLGQTINCPDIWVKNIIPGETIPADDTHQEPLGEYDRKVFVRINNIGVESNHEAKVLVFLAVSDSTTSPTFDFPRDEQIPEINWIIGDDDETNIRKGEVGVYLLEEIEVPANVVPARSGATPGTYEVDFIWKKKDIPPKSKNVNTHLLVHITPFDGEKQGSGSNIKVLESNNISYKPIEITERISFLDANFDPNISLIDLTESIEISSQNPIQNIPFVIFIDNDEFGNFEVEETRITIKRRNKGKANDNLVFSYDGSNWIFENNENPSWITINPPSSDYQGTTPVSGLQPLAYVSGVIDTDFSQKRILIDVETKDDGGATFSNSHVIKFDLEFSGEGFSDQRGARIHAFLNPEDLVVPQVDAYGPISGFENTQFRLNSLHKANNDTRAFAVSDGIICVQPTSDTSLVNIILKPVQQPGINFVPIKYYIYRGILASSLFNNANFSSATEIAPRATSSLTESIWVSNERRLQNQKQKLINENKNEEASNIDITAAPPVDSVGINFVFDPSAGSGGTNPTDIFKDDQAIDNIFFQDNNDIQLPLVRGGWDLGIFDKDNIGFEIVLEDQHYIPTLNSARTLDHTVSATDISSLGSDAISIFENRFAREEVLHYMDPAAFYGAFTKSKIYVIDEIKAQTITRDFRKIRNDDIYESVVSKFLNKNKLYLDIRNELKQSLNFMGNYRNVIELTDPSPEIDPLESTSLFLEKDYQTNDWPILILNQDDFFFEEGDNKVEFSIGFPIVSEPDSDGDKIVENEKPLVYISQGYLSRGLFPFKQLRGDKKFVLFETNIDSTGTANSDFTVDKLELVTPVEENQLVATYVRLIYVKQFTDDYSFPDETPTSGTGKLIINDTTINTPVLRRKYTYDLVFCPRSLSIPLTSGSYQSRSIVLDSETYIDERYTGESMKDYVARIGFSRNDNGSSVFFLAAYDIHTSAKRQRNKNIALIGKKDNDNVLQQVSDQTDGIELVKNNLSIGGNDVSVILLDDVSGDFTSFNKIDEEDFSAIVLTETQRQEVLNIANDLTKFTDKLPVYLGFDFVEKGTDPSGKPYTVLEVVLYGFKINGTAYATTKEETDITIYAYGNI